MYQEVRETPWQLSVIRQRLLPAWAPPSDSMASSPLMSSGSGCSWQRVLWGGKEPAEQHLQCRRCKPCYGGSISRKMNMNISSLVQEAQHMCFWVLLILTLVRQVLFPAPQVDQMKGWRQQWCCVVATNALLVCIRIRALWLGYSGCSLSRELPLFTRYHCANLQHWGQAANTHSHKRNMYNVW